MLSVFAILRQKEKEIKIKKDKDIKLCKDIDVELERKSERNERNAN